MPRGSLAGQAEHDGRAVLSGEIDELFAVYTVGDSQYEKYVLNGRTLSYSSIISSSSGALISISGSMDDCRFSLN